VRQDGETLDEVVEEEIVEAPNAPPDWQLVEKLNQLSQSESTQEVPHPELPQAPDLEPLSVEFEQTLPTLEEPAEEKQMPGDSVTWDSVQATVEEDHWKVNWN